MLTTSGLIQPRPHRKVRHIIIAFILSWITFLSAPSLFAQLDGQIVYPEFYLFQTGDDTAWANPMFDDSHWELRKNVSIPDWKGISWFRFVMEVDTAFWRQSLGLILQVDGAAEFYLDGRLVNRTGTVGGSEEEEISTFNDPSYQTFSLHPSSNIAANKS
ncbi:hypothetical protein MJD09_01455 [bacterium]|nr:hypothetical protein [bacterium]